ncbi:MAG: hypothetical protein ACMUIM_00475, partial [bacterium]
MITSYTSLDLKRFDPNYAITVEGKSVLSFRYAINDTFQILLLVETYNPLTPKVLIQFIPDIGEEGYTMGVFYKVPLSELETDEDFPWLVEVDVAGYIPDIKSIVRIGIRGVDCYIGDIQLKDPVTNKPYPILIDPNLHILEQGWASNNSLESFQVTWEVNNHPVVSPFIYIQGEKVGTLPPSNDSQTNSTSDTSSDNPTGTYLTTYQPYAYPGLSSPVRFSTGNIGGYGYYSGMGLYSGLYGGGMYGGMGLYGGLYGMYGGMGLLG